MINVLQVRFGNLVSLWFAHLPVMTFKETPPTSVLWVTFLELAHMLLKRASDHVRSNPSLQQGIQINIEFTFNRGTNLRKEVNHSVAKVGKEEEPPNNGRSNVTISINQLTACVTPSQHAVQMSETVSACSSLQATDFFQNGFYQFREDLTLPLRFGCCIALCKRFCDHTAEIFGTLAQHSMDMLRPSPLPNSGLAANPK